MIKNAFNNTIKTIPKQLELNDKNGHDSERFVASSLTLALDARISWASRKEDNAKADFITTMLHPWIENRAEVILTQIKSGKTFACINPSNKYVLKLDKSKFNIFTNQNHHTLICWVDRDENDIYWFVIKSTAKFYRAVYGSTHKLSPATKFDLVRVINGFGDRDGGKGLQFAVRNGNSSVSFLKYDNASFKEIRNNAKKEYNRLKKINCTSNIFGEIQITNYGWRHMTRESRWNDYKVSSYEIIPILSHILTRSPSKHFIQNHWSESDKDSEYRKTEYLLEYHNVLKFNIDKSELSSTNVFVKLIEIIKYPIDWKKNARLSQSIERRVYFKSIYYKSKSS